MGERFSRVEQLERRVQILFLEVFSARGVVQRLLQNAQQRSGVYGRTEHENVRSRSFHQREGRSLLFSRQDIGATLKTT